MPKRLLLAIAVSFSPFNVAGFTLPTTLTVPRSSKAGESQIHRLPNQNKYVTSFKASAAVDTDAPTETAALGAWIPLGSASCLDGLTPTQITVCGLDLVVWQSKDKTSKKGALGTFSAFMDACPHRLAPLSQGRVDPVTGCLECPYHGWTFNTNGNLTSVPQLDTNRPLPKDGSATALPVHAAGDLLFVFIPSDVCGESWPIERLPEHHYPYLQQSIDTNRTYHVRDLPYSIDFLLENFMDPAHIPYAHHSLQGVRDDGSPIEMTVLANNFTHVEATFIDICNGKQRDGVISFQRPSFYHFRTRANETEDYVPRLLIYTAPVRSGVCRTMIADFRMPVPKFLTHAASNRFLNSDSWLHDTERAVRSNNKINQIGSSVAVGAARSGKLSLLGMNYIASSQSDLGPSLFRKWWHEHKLSNSPPDFFGAAPPSVFDARPALTRAEQIDPWTSHSKHCSHCRKSLRILKRVQKALVAGASSLAILLRNRPFIAIPMVFISVWAHFFMRKLATVIEGNNHRSEIDDRSVAAMK